MPRTKGLEATAKAYEASIGRVPGNYQEGVNRASGVIEASKAAEPLYAQKMQEAIANQSRLKGLERVSDEDWKRGARDKGAKNIGVGMRSGLTKFRSGMGEVLQTIESITLPPRGATARENVQNRLLPIAEGLEALGKRRRGGA